MKRILAIAGIVIFIAAVRFLQGPDEGPLMPAEGGRIFTSPHCDHIRGYAGPVPLVIVIDKEERITDISLIGNDESPAFIERIRASGYLDSWDGMRWREAMTRDVDAVTEATVTSRAIADTLKCRLSLMSGDGLKRDLALSGEDVFALVFVFAVLLACLVPFKHCHTVRTIFLLFSVIYLGFVRGSFLSVALFAGWIEKGVAWRGMIVFVVIAALAVLVPLFTKRPFYCYYLCPFGAAQELIYKISRWHIKAPVPWGRYLVNIRKTLLIIIAVLLLLDVAVDLTNFEPFTFFLFRSASLIVFAIAAVSLVLSIFLARPWCHYFCPTGAFLDLFR
jgi:hypothetical protein